MDFEALRKAAQPKTKTVDVPEWGQTFTIRQLTAESLLKFDTPEDGDKLNGARQMVACVIDEHGDPVFTEDQIPELISFTAAGFVKLNTAINEFNGLDGKPAKNSEASQS